jgi:hypothetical protein
VVESRALLKLRAPKGLRGFESLPHRQSIPPQIDTNLRVVNGLFQHPPPDAQPQSDPKNTHFRVHNVHKVHKDVSLHGRNTAGRKDQSCFRSMLRKKAIEFPFLFERHGRVGRIKFWSNREIYGTYFRFAGRAIRNSFTTFEAAHHYLEREFARLDRAPEDSPVAFPLRSNVRVYHELEQLLSFRCGAGVSLRDAVDYFLAHKETKQFAVEGCRLRCCLPRGQHAAESQPKLRKDVQVSAQQVCRSVRGAGNPHYSRHRH